MKHYYYVAMTDKFMSGWGDASGKINKLVISCNTLEEAKIVAENAHRRGEMKYVNIHYHHKPYYNATKYHVSWYGREQGDYENWFVEHPEWR